MKRARTITLLLLLTGLLTTVMAGAQQTPPSGLNTHGEVVPGTTAPVIQSAFMLPDMAGGNGVGTIDLIAPYEDAPGIGPVNVTPYLYNSPERWIGFWAFLTSPAGIGDIADVWVDVWHPDGTLKFQGHLTPVACEDIGLPTIAGSPAAGAVTTAQKTVGEFTASPGGILDQCRSSLLAPYFGYAEITKDQPFGEYSYRIGAAGLAGVAAQSSIYQFEVLQRAALALDFSGVDFGIVSPLSSDIIGGDSVWSPGSDNNRPTVASVGNVWINLAVDFNPMVGSDRFNTGKVIDVFDLVLGAPLNANPLGQARSELPVIMSNYEGAAQIGSSDDVYTIGDFALPPNCPVAIQFSIHPEARGIVRTRTGQVGLPTGVYNGVVRLWGVPSVAQWTEGWDAALVQCRIDIDPPAAGN